MDEETVQILSRLYLNLKNRKRLDESLCTGCHRYFIQWVDQGENDKRRGYCSLLCQNAVHNLFLGHKRLREEREIPNFRELLLLLDEPVLAKIIVYTYPYYDEEPEDFRAILDLREESDYLKALIDRYILGLAEKVSEEVTNTLNNETLSLLPSLEELYLGEESQISYIGSLTNLRNLVISLDPVGENSLERLVKLTKLIVLNNSTISGKSLAKLTKLNTLAILLNDTLTDNDIALFPDSIRALVLDECTKVQETGIKSLSRLTGLVQLELRKMTFQDWTLKNLTKLEDLTIEKNDHFLGNNDSLAGMRLLTSLVILECPEFHGYGIPYKSALEMFFAGDTKIDDSTLSSQIHINTLQINNTTITDNKLKELVNLSRLSARNSPRLAGACFQILTKLEFLDISGCQFIIRKNLVSLTNLTELYLSNTSIRTSKNEQPLKFPFLQKLWLRESETIQNRDIVHFTRLVELSLARNKIIQGKAYLRNLTSLLSLDLSYNTVIENEDIESFTRLEILVLEGNTLIKSYALRNMPNLKEIILPDGTVTDDRTWLDFV